jgi:hypothetical protein
MKSPNRSATPALSDSMPDSSRWLTCPPLALTLLLSIFLILPLRAQAGLPRVAISIPADQTVGAGLTAAEQCEVPGKLIVLPTLSFNFGHGEIPAGSSEQQAVERAPEASEIWLHVVVESDSGGGKESEQEISDRINRFVHSLPLSAKAVRGLVVETKQPLVAPDLLSFGLVRLSLAIKANNAALQLAFVFQPRFAGSHGDIVRRLATYSDLLGTTYSEGWRQDIARLSEQGMNKPLILKLNAEDSAAASPFLGAMLASGEPSPQVLWAEPPDSKAAAALCTASSFLSRSITSNMFATNSATSPFKIAVDGVKNEEHHWFVGGPSDLVIVARVNASPSAPKTIKLSSVKPGPFEIKWYDPATGATVPADEVKTTDKGFEQTLECTSEYALISIQRKTGADRKV